MGKLLAAIVLSGFALPVFAVGAFIPSAVQLPSRRCWACLWLTMLTMAPPVLAQVTVPDEYGKTIQHHSEIATLKDDFAGDRIDLSTGRLDIAQTDIDVPGNNALPVRVSRRFQPADVYNGGHFGSWTMDLPSIRGTFPRLANWHWGVDTGDGSTSFNRCSSFGPPPEVRTWQAKEYWHGNTLHLPSGGDRELLVNGGHKPNDGFAYPVGTKDGDAVRCVALASTSVSGSQGEGFEVVTTDGVVYTLNQMVIGNQSSLSRASSGASMLAAGGSDPPLPREEVILFPTKVTDRFGNTVTYQWSATEPWQLLHIVASDGRHLDFTYETSTSKRVTSVKDGVHTWTYAYDTVPGKDTLTLPDGGVWSFQVQDLFRITLNPTGTHCDAVDGSTERTGWTSGPAFRTGSITSPSGATVTFGMNRILLGRSYAFYDCKTSDDPSGYPAEPYLFLTAAVVSKSLTGPGLPAGMTWTYSYGPTNNCWNAVGVVGKPCTVSSATTRMVNVTDPNSDVTRYTFGNKYNENEGLLLKTEYGWNGTTALRTVDIEYGLPTAAPYAPFRGWSIRESGDREMTGYAHPQRKVVTKQQGRTFTWEVATGCSGYPYCFDAFARPNKVVKTGSP